MKALWWKLTVEWPCAMSDWLWFYIAVPLIAHLERLTFRLVLRVGLQIAMLAFLLYFFMDLAALHVTFLFTLDANIYFEAATALAVLTAQSRAKEVFGALARPITRALQTCANYFSRLSGRQRRNSNAANRKKGGRPQADDEPPAWIGLVLAG